ncbi:hypothetical protein PCAR4_260087 [Paraburkholderia caribensis]|nr:hypothetical protein PCAR4_260087 [Paraburkholderia caribensis]
MPARKAESMHFLKQNRYSAHKPAPVLGPMFPGGGIPAKSPVSGYGGALHTRRAVAEVERSRG